MEANKSTWAAIVTAVVSLTGAGYQYNKAELAEMQSTVKMLIAKNELAEVDKRSKAINEEIKTLGEEKTRLVTFNKRLTDEGLALQKSMENKGALNNLPKNLVVFIQVKKDDATAIKQAKIIKESLKLKGYFVPAIDQVQAVPNSNELRYVYKDDEAAAKELLTTIAAVAQDKTQLREFTLKPPMKQYEGKSPKKTVELWFSSN